MRTQQTLSQANGFMATPNQTDDTSYVVTKRPHNNMIGLFDTQTGVMHFTRSNDFTAPALDELNQLVQALFIRHCTVNSSPVS